MFSVHFPSGNFSYEEKTEKLCIRSALLPNKTSGEFGGFYHAANFSSLVDKKKESFVNGMQTLSRFVNES